MNDTDMRRVRNAIFGVLQHLGTLSQLVTAYRDGKVYIGYQTLPLTADQKVGIGMAIVSRAAKIETRVASLETPTGKVGSVDAKILAHMQEAPARAIGYAQQYGKEAEDALTRAPQEQPDGNWSVVFDDGEAQQWADKLVTLAAGVTFFVGTERLKVAGTTR